MAFPESMILEIKALLPSYPKHNGVLRKVNNQPGSRTDKFCSILEKYNYQHLLEHGTVTEAFRAVTRGFEELPICPSPGCNNVLIQKLNPSRYCCMKCYKSDPNINKVLSDIKYNLYNDPVWKDSVEGKKKSTLRKKYGVDHPMQSAEIFAKHERVSMQSQPYKGLIGVRGFEPIVIDYFISKGLNTNEHIFTGVTVMKQNDWDFVGAAGNRQYPDLYISSYHSFVEVKSPYTLEKDWEKIKELPEIIQNVCGATYEVLVVENKKIYSVDFNFPGKMFPNKFDN